MPETGLLFALTHVPLWLPVVLLCLALMALPLLLLPPALASNRRAARRYRRSYLTALAVALGFLLLLSGCGTAPLPAATCPPVPASLMTPPAQPVLLQADTPSKTPGPTTR